MRTEKLNRWHPKFSRIERDIVEKRDHHASLCEPSKQLVRVDINRQGFPHGSAHAGALFLLVSRRVVHSPFGVSLQALRDNRLRAGSIGLSVNLRLVAVYTVAAAIAGAAGALLAQTSGFASLDVFDFHRSAEVLLVLVIGGTGYLYGGIFGAIVFKLLHDLISAWTPQYWNFWLGLFLVVLVLVGRDRLVRPWTGWRR